MSTKVLSERDFFCIFLLNNCQHARSDATLPRLFIDNLFFYSAATIGDGRTSLIDGRPIDCKSNHFAFESS